MNLDSLSFFSLNFIQRNGAVLIFLVGNDFRFTASESVCQLGNFYNFTYSDNSINNNIRGVKTCYINIQAILARR